MSHYLTKQQAQLGHTRIIYLQESLFCKAGNRPEFLTISGALGPLQMIINPLALELEIYSLAHHLCKM
jgi:hypothetical protein